MKLSKSMCITLLFLTSLFARDLSLQTFKERIMSEQSRGKRNETFYNSLNAHIEYKSMRKLPKGTASVECPISLPSGSCVVSLVDSFGVVVATQQNNGNTAAYFEGVWPGTYTIHAGGYGTVNNTYSRLVGVHGTTDTLFSSATFKTVEADKHIKFSTIIVQDFPVNDQSDSDTLIIKGTIRIEGKTPQSTISGTLKYATGDFFSQIPNDVFFDESGDFEHTIITRGEKLIAKWTNLKDESNNYANCWLTGESLNNDYKIIEFTNNDTLWINLDLKKGNTIHGTVKAELVNRDSIFYTRVNVYSENGRYIASDYMYFSDTASNKFNILHIPDGKYYLVVDAMSSGIDYCYYPSTYNVSEAEMVSLEDGITKVCDINLGRIDDYDSFKKNVLPLKIKVRDKDGDIVKAEDYQVKPYGHFTKKTIKAEDSVTSITFTGLDSIQISVEHEESHFLSRGWYGGDSKESAIFIKPRSSNDTLNVEIKLEEAGLVKGFITDNNGDYLDSLQKEFYVDDYDDCAYDHSVFLTEDINTTKTNFSHGFNLIGVKGGNYKKVRILPTMFLKGAKIPIDNIEMYQGGSYDVSFSVEKLKSTIVNVEAPIVKGRLDTKVFIDDDKRASHLLCLVDESGFIVSYTETMCKYKWDILSNEDKFLGINPKIKRLHTNISKTFSNGALFGIGKGEYYLLALTMSRSNEDVFHSWYGLDKDIKSSNGDQFMFPYVKLDIPSDAKTIKFDTDSTWIKDFQWDITPVVSDKKHQKASFNTNVIGKSIQVSFPERFSKATLQLVTLNGRLLKEIDVAEVNSFQWNVKDVAKGMYVLQTKVGSKVYSEQIILK